MTAWVRIYAVCIKEFRQLRRDRLTFGMVVMIPLMQLLLFGYTINTDVRHVPIVVVDHAQSTFSRILIADAQASQVVKIVARLNDSQQAINAVKNGQYSAALIVEPDAETRYRQHNQTAIARLVVDGSDTVMASALKSLSNLPIADSNRARVAVPELPNANIAVQLLYNPAQRAALFTVPGLLGLILLMTMTMFTSISIVRERERGNMELLIATPVRTIELMTGKLIPYVLIGFIQMLILLTLGISLFAMPIVGSLVLLVGVCLIFIIANLGLGLLISTIASNQLAAVQMFIFYMLPSILLSGFMFPFVAMPRAAQWLAELLPLTHFLRIARGVILRGADLSGFTYDLLFLVGFFILTLMMALLRFRQRID